VIDGNLASVFAIMAVFYCKAGSRCHVDVGVAVVGLEGGGLGLEGGTPPGERL
jgi:hypothetical protein